MELTQLRYFRVLAESKSLSKAAEKLFISPPALSASIARLEKELGTTLFDRRQTLVLNERGQIFLEYITQALSALDNAQEAMRDANKARQGHLTIGVGSAVVWQDLFLEFTEKFPNVRLEHQPVTLKDMSDERILDSYDFIIAAPQDLSTEKLHSVTLYDDDWPTLMVPWNHPLASRKEIALSEVKDENFIALTKGNSSRKYFDDLCAIAGFKPKIVVECGMEMRQAFVLAGRGIALATAHTRLRNTEPRICFLDIINPFYRRSQCLYWHGQRYQTAAARAFREFAMDFFRNGILGKSENAAK